MNKIIKEIIKSFKARPAWTTYNLMLAPFYYLLVAVTAILIGLIMLDYGVTEDFWNENT